MSISVRISASSNRLFWNDADRLAERRALLHVVERPAERGLGGGAPPATAIDSRSCGRLSHEVREALALVAEQVVDRHLHVGEEQLGGVLGVQADLVEVAAPLEAVHAPLEHEQAHALVASAAGSVLTAVITRSALMPLVMNVFEPLTT